MTSDREYATEVLKTVIFGNARHLAERLLAALEREEKLREMLTEVVLQFDLWSEDANDGTYAYYRSDGLMVACVAARKALHEPHGNFSDTQDSNPEGGC